MKDDQYKIGHYVSPDELPGGVSIASARLYCGKGGINEDTGTELASGYLDQTMSGFCFFAHALLYRSVVKLIYCLE